MPAHFQALLSYAAGILLVAGIIIGVWVALRTRHEAREGVDLVNEADMLSEFQRALESGEIDEAEFRRVRDLLIDGKRPQGATSRGPSPSPEPQPPPLSPESPKTTDPA